MLKISGGKIASGSLVSAPKGVKRVINNFTNKLGIVSVFVPVLF